MNRRGPAPRDKRAHRKREAHYAASLRTCCATYKALPHAPDCERHPTKCGGKTGFQSRDLAIARAGQLRASMGEMTVYRCPSCGLFHMGHPMSVEEGLDE